jgi:hypothetical protein
MFEKPILKLVKFNVMDICSGSSEDESVKPCDTELPIVTVG